MKAKLIALAAMAVSGAALAQSSVTVYGRMDLSVGSEKNQLANTSTSKVFSGNLTTSRLGFRGTEDLGGGLKAIFQIETAISADAPGTTTLGDRHAIVGLSGGFGTVKLGRTETVYKDIYDLAVSSNVFDSKFTPNETVYAETTAGGLNGFSSRRDNQIRYESPSFSGFTFGVSFAMDEQASPVKQDVTAYNLRYKAGALDVGLGYQEQKNNSTPANDREYTALSGAYNFGVARVSAGYQNTKTGANTKDNEYSIGVNVPMDKFNFSVGYANSKSKNAAGATTGKGSGFGLGVTYSLSKRTTAYAGWRDTSRKTAAGVKTADERLYAAGIRHDF